MFAGNARLLIVMFLFFGWSDITFARLLCALDFEQGRVDDWVGSGLMAVSGNPTWCQQIRDDYHGLELDGRDQIVLKNEGLFKTAEQITVSAWIKIRAFKWHAQPIVNKGTYTTWLHRAGFGESVVFTCPGTIEPRRAQATSPVNDGKWHHVVGTCTKDQVCIYIDGVLEGQSDEADSLIHEAGPVYIGGISRKAGEQFDGWLDDVAIFDHALSAEQVQQLFHEGIEAFIEHPISQVYVDETVQAIKGMTPKHAVIELEHRIDRYLSWLKDQYTLPYHMNVHTPPRLWFLLARHREQAGAERGAVVDAYQGSLFYIHGNMDHLCDALMWLIEQGDPGLFQASMAELFKRTRQPGRVISTVTAGLFEKRDWATFKMFAQFVVSPEVGVGVEPYMAATLIAHTLGPGHWQDRFRGYCASRANLMKYLFASEFKRVNHSLLQKNYSDAADAYKTMAENCAISEKSAEFHYEACRCLYEAQDYSGLSVYVDSLPDSFEAQFGYLNARIVAMQASVYTKTGQPDKAGDLLLKVMIEHENTPEGLKSSFLLGYTAMLQGQYGDALNALQLHVQLYPKSPYRNRTNTLIGRLKSMGVY